MEIRKLLIKTFVATVAILAISCSETINKVEETLATANDEKSSELASAPGDSCTYSGTLSAEEISSLMVMREEEKLAHDVYLYFYEIYNHIIFSNISKSESAHTDAVLNLIKGYGLEDPAINETGVFSNPLFNELYTSLTEQGSADLIAALKVGAFIEEYDINDLTMLLENTKNEDVYRVYNNLRRGSGFHLKAFTNVLQRFGETYNPEIISEEEYQEIVGEESTNSDSWTPGYYYNSSDSTICDGTGPNF